MLNQYQENLVELVENNQTEKVKKLLEKIIIKNNSTLINSITDWLNHYTEAGHTVLLTALENKNEELANFFIQYGSNVNAQCKHKYGDLTPLHIALELGFITTLTLLLDHPNIDVNLLDYEYNLPLHKACIFYDKLTNNSPKLENVILDIIEKLIDKGNLINLDQENKEQLTPLYISIIKNHPKLCQLLLKKGANINQYTKEYCTYINLAIKCQYTEIVKIIMAHYHDNNLAIQDQPDCTNNNLLHIAAHYSNTEIITELLNYKIDINARNNALFTPLGEALFAGNIENAKCLIENGADITSHISSFFNNKQSYLYYLSNKFDYVSNKFDYLSNEFDDLYLMELLIEYGAPLNEKSDKENLTVLQSTIKNNQYEKFSLLIKSGADPYIQDIEGNTVLHYIVKNNASSVFTKKLLKNQTKIEETRESALINVKNNNNDSVLHMAIQYEIAMETFKLLLSFPKINIDIKNSNGQTPLHIAIRRKNSDLINLLLNSGAKISIKDNFNCNAFQHAASVPDVSLMSKFIGMCSNIGKYSNDSMTDIKKFKSSLLAENSLELKIMDCTEGKTPITHLIINGYWSDIEFLTKYSPDLKIKDNSNPLWKSTEELIADNQYIHIVPFIQRFNYILNYIDNKNLTLIHYFVKHTRNFQIIKNLDDKLYQKMFQDTRMFLLLITENQKENIRLFLNNGYNINRISEKGETALSIALNYNKKIIPFLLRNKANPNIQDHTGKTPLHLAAKLEDIEATTLLLSKQANPNIQDYDGNTPLFYAIKNLQIFELLLKEGAKSNIANKLGLTVFFYASQNIEKNRYVITELLEKSAKENVIKSIIPAIVNSTDENNTIKFINILVINNYNIDEIVDHNGSTLLHHAASNDHLLITQYLVNNKLIDIDRKDKDRNTPLNFALKFTNNNTNTSIKWLIENEASFTMEDIKGNSPIVNALLYKNYDVAKEMIISELEYDNDKTSILNPKKSHNDHLIESILKKINFNELYKAILDKNLIKLQDLIDNTTIDINEKDIIQKYTPLHYAVNVNFIEGVKALLKKDHININSLDDKKRSPIFYAIITKNLEITSLLLNKGAHIYLKDINDRNLLYHAIENNFLEAIDLLPELYDNFNINMKGPLHHTIEIKSSEAMEKLLLMNKDSDSYKFSKIPILHYAVIHNFSRGIQLILKYNKELASQLHAGRTALHYAARNFNINIFKQLLPYIDSGIKDNEELTAVDILLHSLQSQVYYMSIKKNFTEQECCSLEFPSIKIGTPELPIEKLLQELENIWKVVKNKSTAYKTDTIILFLFLTNNMKDLYEILTNITNINAKVKIYQELKKISCIHPTKGCIFEEILSSVILNSLYLPNYFTTQEPKLYTQAINEKLIAKDTLPLLYSFQKKRKNYSDEDKSSTVDDLQVHQRFTDEVIKKLIIKKGNPILNHSTQMTLLHYAAVHNNVELTQIIATKNNVNHKTSHGVTALFYNILYGGANLELIKTLLENLANANCKIVQDITPLHCASIINNVEVTKLLLEYGASINSKTICGKTPLFWSIFCKNSKNTKYLLTQPNINAKDPDKYGITPLHMAIFIEDLEIIEQILKITDIDLNHKDDNGNSPLILATLNNNLIAITSMFELRKKEIDVNLQDNEGNSAIFHAIANDNVTIVKFLLENHASISLKNKKGISVIEYCIIFNAKNSFNEIISLKRNEVENQLKNNKININNIHIGENNDPYFLETISNIHYKVLKNTYDNKRGNQMFEISLEKFSNSTSQQRASLS